MDCPGASRRARPSTDYDAYFRFEDRPVLRDVLREVSRLSTADFPLAARLRAAAPLRPPLRAGPLLVARPRPDPLFSPPWSILLTVAHARRSASPSETPRSSYPSSMCSACRFCLSV